MTKNIQYSFTAKAWKHPSPGGWHFISLPTEISEAIRIIHKTEEEGWGRLKVIVKTGNTEWETAIWFDTKSNTYLLPLKATIRKKENLFVGAEIDLAIWI